MEVLPAILVAGLLISVSQLLIATFNGPWTAGILSAIVTLARAVAVLQGLEAAEDLGFPRSKAKAPSRAGAPVGCPASFLGHGLPTC